MERFLELTTILDFWELGLEFYTFQINLTHSKNETLLTDNISSKQIEIVEENITFLSPCLGSQVDGNNFS